MGSGSNAKRERRAVDTAASQLRNMEGLNHRRMLARGRRKIESLIEAEEMWRSRDCRLHHERVDGFTDVYVVADEQPDPESADIVGEALVAMRSSLDHLVVSLARAAHSDLTEQQEKRASFPIDDHEAIKTNDRRLRSLTQGAREAVVGLLPDPSVPQAQTHTLYGLNRMANLDKHRDIHVVGYGAFVGRLTLGGSGYQDYLKADGGPIESGRVRVLRYRQRDPGIRIDADVRPVLAFDGATQWAPGRPVIPVLEAMYDHVRDEVFPVLEAFL